MHQHVLRLHGKLGTIIKRSQVHWKGISSPRRPGASDSPYCRRLGPTTLAVTACHVHDFAATAGPQQLSGTNYAPSWKTISPSSSPSLQPIPSTTAISPSHHLTISASSTDSTNGCHQHHVEVRNPKRDKRNGTSESSLSYHVSPSDCIPSTDPARLRVLPIPAAAEPQDSARLRTPLCPSHPRHLPLIVAVSPSATHTHPPVFAINPG